MDSKEELRQKIASTKALVNSLGDSIRALNDSLDIYRDEAKRHVVRTIAEEVEEPWELQRRGSLYIVRTHMGAWAEQNRDEMAKWLDVPKTFSYDDEGVHVEVYLKYAEVQSEKIDPIVAWAKEHAVHVDEDSLMELSYAFEEESEKLHSLVDVLTR